MEIGRHLVLSTVHVSMKTADLLDGWATLEPSSRPLAVASTHYGWFIPTREAEEPDREKIPDEVLAAMRRGRELACDYLLFDCDACAVEGLTTFPW
ncbi:hypothetical protein NT2_06_02210 [Caenibius tardaugens NBRC 16725]|uniref:DUF5983 domain-containing protein n=1 Tax=Caenibius tardaugens NBRC 16725 TaxID=1219035 RepID=U2Y925_9SPHN|nr:hypothetical protein [Caenibius tardaugens]AZI37676.1 hypothetical protein EGO55_18280 [Caenibius tardaugens NBRC 16725]GAD49781.1 hypothetical protein NT2_06_02210 [Caenibius tardaugens NBRC 16725]